MSHQPSLHSLQVTSRPRNSSPRFGGGCRLSPRLWRSAFACCLPLVGLRRRWLSRRTLRGRLPSLGTPIMHTGGAFLTRRQKNFQKNLPLCGGFGGVLRGVFLGRVFIPLRAFLRSCGLLWLYIKKYPPLWAGISCGFMLLQSQGVSPRRVSAQGMQCGRRRVWRSTRRL